MAHDIRAFLVTAGVLGLAYIFVTPPFQVPDEVGHFWRGEAIAGGHLLPTGGRRPDSAQIPMGLKTLVWVMHTSRDMRTAYAIPLEPIKEPVVRFPAWYTPVPYIPQAIAGVITRVGNIRPLVSFYLGRLANLMMAIGIVAAGMLLAPGFRTILAAVALLPMTLFLFASWSADALTIAACLLLTALLLAEKEPPIGLVLVVALVVALCKPAYFLLSLIAGRKRIIPVIGVTAAGTAISFAYAHLASYPQRSGLPVDPISQLQCIAHSPLRFGCIMLRDVAVNGMDYIEEAIGRLGLMELKLPAAVIAIELALLIAIGLTAEVRPTIMQRAVAMAIVVVTAAGILLSQYLSWSIICSDVIEGVQGRYFLPALPLGLAALSLPRIRWRVELRWIIPVALASNGIALVVLFRRYWL